MIQHPPAPSPASAASARSPLAWAGAALALVALALTLLTSNPAAAEERRIIVEGFEADHSTMSLQLGFGGLNLSDDALSDEGVARLGGMNLTWRWDPVDWGGLEVGVGSYLRQSEGGLVTEHRGTFSLAWLWYFARHYHHRFYGVTGITSMSTTVDIGDNEALYYGEGGLTLGLGSEWLISKNWIVNIDARVLMLASDSEEGETFEAEPSDAAPDGSARSPYPASWTTAPAERTGLLMNVGVGYRW